MPSYDQALELMHAWTASDSLRRHMYAVEAALRACARRLKEDEQLWAITGLLHDFDYEKHPSKEQHPFVGVEELRRRQYPEVMIEAILGHATYSGVPRRTPLAKALFACDELSGLVTAAVYVRPDRSIHGLKLKSLKKKFKDKRFAAGVDRDEVRQAATEFGADLDQHMQFMIDALAADAERLGLAGSV
ncbi:MAG: HDIG domain-containing protein [Phycisphaerae bacterium]|nr:HDIG domain-containing protein [Phycisphaerae bacterium]